MPEQIEHFSLQIPIAAGHAIEMLRIEYGVHPGHKAFPSLFVPHSRRGASIRTCSFTPL